MALFRLAIGYAGTSAEETVELEANNPAEARKMCDEMIERNREELERLAGRNVYSSRDMRSCRLCPYDYKMEMVGIDKMLKSLEDHV